MQLLLAGRIRREREARGWAIAELASASGVSRAMISKVERGEASPTATLLGRLSGAFGLTVSALLARAESDGGAGRVMRAAEQEVWTDPETGYRRRQLTPPGADPELVHVEMPAGGRVGYPAASYAFMRGHSVWLISGGLVIREGDGETVLSAGDCLSFDLATPQDREYVNPTSAPCRYVVTLARR
ncbi:helix-turn-helix domain-containing protein [Roseococcus pinisoli]|uniref:helix-turn-helix domain-containing protein n=1 Tax=Roseococcus pinisoli TaxID=2835040 RepID=UPI0020BD7380|nr:XRE family transcriptional regulator [Roseococcus pinisoli]